MIEKQLEIVARLQTQLEGCIKGYPSDTEVERTERASMALLSAAETLLVLKRVQAIDREQEREILWTEDRAKTEAEWREEDNRPSSFNFAIKQNEEALQKCEGITIGDRFIPCDPNEVSDGYHTFGELYDHRCLLFIQLLGIHSALSFASLLHDDGTEWKGWFIAGCKLDGGLVTYHLPTKFASLIPNKIWIPKAPPWDGHTSKDVCDRLIEEAAIAKGILDQE